MQVAEVPSRIFLANVGVNAAHRWMSPVFSDGTFEFVTIPEDPGPAAPPMLRYADLACFNHPAIPLTTYLPSSASGVYTHADPEFTTFTYGDNCDRNSRAAGLRHIRTGDALFFLARLVPWENGRFVGPPGFYLVGFLHVAELYSSIRERPAENVLARIGGNAHVRRGLASPEGFDGFWVFCGSKASVRFRYAVPVDRALAKALFTAADGAAWQWPGHRSDLQVIGSYTRACRCVIDPATPGGPERARLLWDAVAVANTVRA